MATTKELERMIVALRKRIDASESWQHDMDAWRSDMQQVVNELRTLNQTVKDIAAALRVFTLVGNGAKWVLGLGASLIAASYALKQWLNGQ
jgi:hypothetical protein